MYEENLVEVGGELVPVHVVPGDELSRYEPSVTYEYPPALIIADKPLPEPPRRLPLWLLLVAGVAGAYYMSKG